MLNFALLVREVRRIHALLARSSFESHHVTYIANCAEFDQRAPYPVSTSDIAEDRAKKRHTRVLQFGNIARQFADGIGLIGVDMKVKDEIDPIRVWLAVASESRRLSGFHEVEFQAIYEEGDAEKPHRLVAGMAIERGYRVGEASGIAIFTSLVSGCSFGLLPPVGCPTGDPVLDRRIERGYMKQNVGHDLLSLLNEGERNSVNARLTADLVSMEWSIHPNGFFVQPRDDRFEVIDAFLGPL